jgi:S-(hydroxymethyl)mycothiol dehydrogenase
MESPIRAKGVVVREANGPAVVEELELDPPGPGEVLIRIVASGVCHSDLHTKHGAFGRSFPYLLGHEATGVVEARGAGVDRLQVGQTVMLNWRAPCGQCAKCRSGLLEYCIRPATAGARMRTKDGAVLQGVLGLGTFATHTVVAAAQAIPVASDLAPEATCLIGCAVATGVGAALFAAQVRMGSSVAVFGCGAVGINVIQGARLAHARRIIGVDLVPEKLHWATRFGATDVVDGSQGDAAAQIRELTDGGVDYAFEAVGAASALEQSLRSCALAGECTMIGVPHPTAELTLSMASFFYRRTRLRSTFYGDCIPARDFPLLVDWYRQGKLYLDDLVTERIGLDQVEEAFAAMQHGKGLRSVIVNQ